MRRKKAKAVELVKITPSGKVTMVIGRIIKPTILSLLENWINKPSADKKETNPFAVMHERRPDAGAINCSQLISKALVEEVYKKYYMMLHINQEGKMSLSPAQAFALFEVLHEQQPNPMTVMLFTKLHQILLMLAK